jgi:hypothetical protein
MATKVTTDVDVSWNTSDEEGCAGDGASSASDEEGDEGGACNGASGASEFDSIEARLVKSEHARVQDEDRELQKQLCRLEQALATSGELRGRLQAQLARSEADKAKLAAANAWLLAQRAAAAVVPPSASVRAAAAAVSAFAVPGGGSSGGSQVWIF